MRPSTRSQTRRARDDGGEDRSAPAPAPAAVAPPAKRQKKDDAQRGSPPQEQPERRAAWSAFLRTKCFLSAPDELFDVYELAAALHPEKPTDAFVEMLGLRLCGPFDLLSAATAEDVEMDKPLHLHGRFFHDPPEVITVMVDVSSSTGRHWGYLRDAPEQTPEYVVCAEDSSECKFDVVAPSIAQALERRLDERVSTVPKDVATNLYAHLAACGDKVARSSSQSVAYLRKERSKASVAASLSQLGIVVPVNAKTNTGYRELPTAGSELQELLDQVRAEGGKKGAGSARKRLSELITRATIASDECDFGTGLLLGLDLFSAGPCLEKEALQLLRVAYMLLRRSELYKVASGQCKHRQQGAITERIQAIAPRDGERVETPESAKYSKVELPAPLVSTTR